MNRPQPIDQSANDDWLDTSLPQSDDAIPSLLRRHLTTIRERIVEDGLMALSWVSGVYTQDIASSLLEAISRCTLDDPAPERCILLKPGEAHLGALLRGGLNSDVENLPDHQDDSYLIVNGAVVLDMTPIVSHGGRPEFSDDAAVASVYVSHFNRLRQRCLTT